MAAESLVPKQGHRHPITFLARHIGSYGLEIPRFSAAQLANIARNTNCQINTKQIIVFNLEPAYHGRFKSTFAVTSLDMPLSNQQLRVISIAERAGGVLSLLGCLLIVTTYCSSAAFRRPVRRLIFYATLGNAFSAVACLISNDGPKAGPDSALCQLQAFFIQ